MRTVLGIALLVAGLAAADAVEPPVHAYVTLEPPVVPFHQQARYSVVAEVSGDTEVQMPDMVDKFGGLSVYGVPERSEEAMRGGRRRIVLTYTLDPVFAGLYAIAPAVVRWGDGEEVVVPSPGLRVRDLTEEERAAAEYFAPNAGPIYIGVPLWRSWKVWAAVGVILAAGAGVALYRAFRGGKQTVQAPPPVPWEVAYQRLRELDQRQLPKTGKYEPYYVDLSAILRYYIEDRFHLHAPERTTPEFLAEAAGSGELSEAHQALVAGFLRHCDRVKFAQYRPGIEEMERSFADVLRFVDETVPAPPSQEEEGAAA